MSKKRIKTLEDLMIHHKQKYYQGQAEISDSDYDQLEDELRKLAPDSFALQIVGYEVSEEKIKHASPMLSLSKCREQTEVISWMKAEPCLVSNKMDGSSASLIYKKGKFLLAKTRGDGTYGENLTKYFRYISIPKKLLGSVCKGKDIEIRGEVCISKSNFARVCNAMTAKNLTPPKSIRNIVAGLLHKKTNLDLCQHLDFLGYDLIAKQIDFKTEEEKFEIMAQEKFLIPRYTRINSSDGLTQAIENYQNSIGTYEYLTDGLVLAINNYQAQINRGFTGHHPKGKIAYKFESEKKVTTIKDIIVDVGRTGKLSFVGLVEPVSLSGATVQRVTLHNIKYILDHNINLGCLIQITRSGEVIPKHEKTIKTNGTYKIPEKCPLCQTKVVFNQTAIDLICENLNCKARKYGQIAHWIDVVGIDNIGDSTLEKLFEKKIVTKIGELYRLKSTDISSLEKHGDKSAKNIIDNIESKKELPLETILTALGIEGLGRGIVRLIIKKYPTMTEITSLNIQSLLNIKGIGEVLADNIFKGLEENRPLLDELKHLGIKIEDNSASKAGLDGQTFVITGTLSKSRKEIEKFIETHGGKITKAVSKKTSYLICNQKSSSSKYIKAEKTGVKIINEDFLFNLIQEENYEV